MDDRMKDKGRTMDMGLFGGRNTFNDDVNSHNKDVFVPEDRDYTMMCSQNMNNYGTIHLDKWLATFAPNTAHKINMIELVNNNLVKSTNIIRENQQVIVDNQGEIFKLCKQMNQRIQEMQNQQIDTKNNSPKIYR